MRSRFGRFAVWIYCAITAFALIYPCARLVSRTDIGYNEGWNVYNAASVADHHYLYAHEYDWTTVNYPTFSFVAIGHLNRFTSDFLLTGRLLCFLSLLGCAATVALIVNFLVQSLLPGILAGLLCTTMFCANASVYVGQDDPQFLACSCSC